MPFSRRSFLSRAPVALITSKFVLDLAAAPPVTPPGVLIVSTWPFAVPGNDRALEILLNGGPPLDAVEQGVRVVETGPNSGSVGLGGIPNAAGVVQLDASIMEGREHKAGSVAALEGFAHPISIARRVMEKTPHVLLVGEGARLFALKEGFESESNDGPQKHAAWFEKQKADAIATPPKQSGHDTITLLVLGSDGRIAGGCSTSGIAHKMPGRVGDSPIIGGGLYVDDAVGAAGATGRGENIMRYCGSFLVVEYMRQGLSPAEACLKVVNRIVADQPAGKDPQVNFIALDKQGRYGAAGSAQGFKYCVTTRAEKTSVLTAPGGSAKPIGAEGGHR
jgi:N4-(beta-N-acetylglucosaminyl)-L-asparaginase